MPAKLIKLFFIKTETMQEYHSTDPGNEGKSIEVTKDGSTFEVSEVSAQYLTKNWPKNFLQVGGPVHAAYLKYQDAAEALSKKLSGGSEESDGEGKEKK